jgi:dipeptidyl aminopeptidase/acylaminoacyl peptidase
MKVLQGDMAMKTIRLLLATLLLVCCRDRSAPPTVLSAGDESRDSRNASSEADARQSNAASLSVAQPQTQEVELWDPNDDRNIAGRILERVKQEGVFRIVGVLASRDKYVFVGEFEVSSEVVPAERPMSKNGSETLRAKRPPPHGTDLWLVNKNGTGLRRLTDDGESHDPVLSPSGEEIAFVSKGSVRIIGSDSRVGDDVFYGSVNSRMRDAQVEYSQLRFSPNGKGIAALAKDGTTSWVEVRARPNRDSGNVTFAEGFERYEWNSKSDLVLDYGRLVFDWEHSNSEASANSAANTSTLKTDKAGDGQSPLPPKLLKRLLKKLRPYGVMNIGSYAISPSANQIVFAGEFEEASSAIPNKADLWVVNRDGAGLRQLTHNHYSSQPAWSPSGKEIAFVNDGSVSVIDAKTRNVRSLPGLQTSYHPSEGPMTHAHWDFVYLRPRWSPNGAVITAEGVDDSEGWIAAVGARSGNKLLETSQSGTRFSWNHEGELVIPALGKFIFDWSSAIVTRYRHEKK